MSWRDNLRPASYRGVTFFVEAAEREGGQRVVAHTFPQRLEPLVEWFGRQVRQFRITGFLVGEDYARDLQRLIAGFEKPPPNYPFNASSHLVHPYLGSMRVVPRQYRVKESSAEGRIARIEMTFIEAGREYRPQDTTGQVAGKAAEADALASATAAAAIVEELQVVGQAESARAAIAGELSKLGTAIKELDVFTAAGKDAAALGVDVEELLNNAAGVAAAPATLASTVLNLFEGIDAAVGNALGALTAYETLLNLDADQAGGTSAASVTADTNAQLTMDFVGTLAAGASVLAAAQVDWISTNDARAAQDALTSRIDGLLDRARDDVYARLQDIRTVAATGIPAPGRSLPSVETLTLPASQPALLLANQLYDNATREGEIVDRNRVRHPLFVPGGQPLEVLSA